MELTRSRTLLLASGVGVLLLAGILSQRHTEPASTAVPLALERSVNKSATSAQPKNSTPDHKIDQTELRDLPPLTSPLEAPHPQGSPELQDWIATRTAELNALAWQDDPISLRKILAELRNPLPQIRAGALEATRAFGSRDAIPYLQACANDCPEPQEKIALTELIEHLKLPTLLEMSEATKAE